MKFTVEKHVLYNSLPAPSTPVFSLKIPHNCQKFSVLDWFPLVCVFFFLPLCANACVSVGFLCISCFLLSHEFLFLIFSPNHDNLLSEQATKMLQGSCAFDYLSLLMLGDLHFIYLQDRVNGLKLWINAWLPSIAVYVPDSLLLLTVSFCISPGKEGEAVPIWVYSSLNCWNH